MDPLLLTNCERHPFGHTFAFVLDGPVGQN